MPIINMMLGECRPGGMWLRPLGHVRAGIITVFVAGLLVGRTPEYLGKKIGPREIKLAPAVLPRHPDPRARGHSAAAMASASARGVHAEHRTTRAV